MAKRYRSSPVFDLLAHQEITHPNSVVGAARDAKGILSCTIFILHGFIEATANTDAGSFHIQKTADPDNNDNWISEVVISTTDATPVSEPPSGAEAVGQKVIEVASTAGIVDGDFIYFQDTTVKESEWHRVQKIVTGVSIDFFDGLVNAKTTSDLIFTEAEGWVIDLDFRGVRRYRVLYHHEGTTAAETAIWVQGIEVIGFV